MLIKEKIGNIDFFAVNNRKQDILLLEWYETNKRIIHKETVSGLPVTMKFLNEKPHLTEGDVLYEDDFCIILIEINPCDALIIRPKSLLEMAAVCYEIGNRHLPLFYEGGELLVPFEPPLYHLLTAGGYDVITGKRKLLTPLKTSVSPHGNLFSKNTIIKNPPG